MYLYFLGTGCGGRYPHTTSVGRSGSLVSAGPLPEVKSKETQNLQKEAPVDILPPAGRLFCCVGGGVGQWY